MSITSEPWTAEDLQRLSNAGLRCELVKGELIKMSPTGGRHGWITQRLHLELAPLIEQHGWGLVLAPETGVDLTREDETERTVLAADLTVVSPADAEAIDVDGYAAVIPLLVVETASPSQSTQDMIDKGRLWCERGVSQVWILWPVRRELTVLMASDQSLQTFEIAEPFHADDIFPGLSLDLTRIFRRPGLE